MTALEDRTVPTVVVSVETLADAAESAAGVTNGTVRFSRTGPTTDPLLVGYQVSGSAQSDVDYYDIGGLLTIPAGEWFVDVEIEPIDDTIYEPGGESLSVAIFSNPEFEVGGGNSWQSAIVHIADDEPPPAVSVTRIADATEGGANGTFRVTRSGDTSEALTAYYSIDGTAAPGADYAWLSNVVEFAAGIDAVDVPVAAEPDDLLEGSETVVLTLTSGSGYTVGGAGTATLSIIDTIYSSTFDWNGVATVRATVTNDADQFVWNYHLTNDSFTPGIETFALPAEDTSLISNLGNSLGWSGSVSPLLGGTNFISWQAGSALSVGNSANFWFTTPPVYSGMSTAFVSNLGLTTLPGGLLAIPTAAPVPPGPGLPVAPHPALIVTIKVDVVNENDGFLSLREAITEANRLSALHQEQIRITFLTTLSSATFWLEDQLPLITQKIFIDGHGRSQTIRRDEDEGNFRLLVVRPGASLQIARLSLENGYTDVGLIGGEGGGGAIASLGDLTVIDCFFTDNGVASSLAFGAGGAIWAQGARNNEGIPSGKLWIENCEFFGNYAPYGGAVATKDNITDLRISSSTFAMNHASKTGGALYLVGAFDTPTTAQIIGCTLQFNSAALRGGAIFAEDLTLALKGGTTISDNSAARGGGVAISGFVVNAMHSAEIVYDGVSIGRNTASISGTGVYRDTANRINGVGGVMWFGDPLNEEVVV